ncbi:MAG: DUF2927 domain-containing protein [Rhodobacteraceae bacterium]|nr:DUF2927 domain-containing protein [Paracoccaceae bacterium]
MRLVPRALFGWSAAGLCLAVLSGCAAIGPAPDSSGAGNAAAGASVPSPEERPRLPTPPSPESQALAVQFAKVEADLRGRGLLRTDRGGPDAPFDARILADNFIRIALFDEFVPVAGHLVAQETSSRLRRWQDPVRINLEFGDSVSDAQRKTDTTTATDLIHRLASASGHDISVVPEGGNMSVFVVNEDERLTLGPRLRAAMPGITADVISNIRQMPASTFCVVIAFSTESEPYVYRRAVAVIRAEHPPLLRRSCFDEEITQGLGLANDSSLVRPSIFNDDEEYALLTRQDELMLRILYDPRLRPGMNAAEAQPIVQDIAQELLPDASSASAEPRPEPDVLAAQGKG